ncbi:MAG TPA: hypothetical protein VFQ70_01690, partial [Candidatus Saccharimonadaceae bacterium]|nr:hypothetical protein [Candidatus Saccharimonadaceae bacterium]
AGILSVTLGGFIADYHVAQSYSNYQFVVAGITMLILGLLHVLYYRLARRDLVLLFGIILGVSALPLAIDQVLSNLEAPLYSWCLVVAAAAGFLTYVTRVTGRLLPDAQSFVAHAFDGFSAFVILLSLFIASRGDHLIALWFIVLIVAILGMFYLSIVRRNRYFLGNASLFLVVTIITIAFQYFSGFGIATSLLIAALGLLGSAAAATTINKKYIRI